MRLNLNLSAHSYYSKNSNGRDFFIGDIHGKYSLLMQALNKLNFDFNADRLFSVGDVIDRGEESFNCLLLTKENWFIPILGNHEQFLSEFENDNEYKKGLWYKNGGSWWELLNDEERKEAKKIIELNYSLTISVDTLGGKVGVIHAQYPFDRWPIDAYDINRDVLHKLLWSRDNIENGYENRVEGVDFIVSGHTPLSNAILKGNQLFVDTGCGHLPNEKIYNPHLTVCEFKKNNIDIYSVAKGIFEFSKIKI